MEHTLCESPFSCAMKHCGPASRVESINALADRDLGVTEQGLLRVEHGVSLRDPVPHAHFRTSSIVQPCGKRLHVLCHMPNVLFAAFAHNFHCLSWFVLVLGPATIFKLFSFHFMSRSSTALVMSVRIRIKCSMEPAIAYKSSAQHK